MIEFFFPLQAPPHFFSLITFFPFFLSVGRHPLYLLCHKNSIQEEHQSEQRNCQAKFMVQSLEGEACSQQLQPSSIDGVVRSVNNPLLHHRSNVVSKIPTRINGLNGTSSKGESCYGLTNAENRISPDSCEDISR